MDARAGFYVKSRMYTFLDTEYDLLNAELSLCCIYLKEFVIKHVFMYMLRHLSFRINFLKESRKSRNSRSPFIYNKML